MQTSQLPSVPLAKQVARQIRATLGYLGINQAELARRLDVSDMWVSSRLRSREPLTIDLAELEKIAAALDVPIHDLLPPVTDPDLGLRRVTGGAA